MKIKRVLLNPNGDMEFREEYYTDGSQEQENVFKKSVNGPQVNIMEKIFKCDDYRVTFNYIKSDIILHSHDFYEFDIMLDGEIIEYNNFEQKKLHPGDVIIVSPINSHAYKVVESQDKYSVILSLAFNTSFFRDEAKLFFKYDFPQYIKLSEQEIDMISDIIIRAYNNTKESDSFLVKKTMEYLVAFFEMKLEHIDISFRKDNDKGALLNALSYIKSNYEKDITCADVAKKIGYTPNYFSSIFKKAMGRTFSEYILQLRLERARYFIQATTIPISSISSMCGFGTNSYFSSVFKKEYGISPNELRKTK